MNNTTRNKSRFELAQVALGEAEADIAIVNGNIVNVYTGEVLKGDTILIKGDKIAYSGNHPRKSLGPQTRIIEANGKYLIPGLIDGHTHTDYLYSSQELVKYAMKTGTTTIITDVAETTFAMGYPGFRGFLRSVRNQPIKYWISIPPMVTFSPVAKEHVLTLKQIRRFLREREVVGVGELYWGPALTGNQREMEIIFATLEARKKVEGHAAGATANNLQAYTGLGISSDHEPITAEAALERMRLGLSVMIREGEIRQDLQAVSQIKDRRIDFRRLAMSTDGIGPVELTTRGFMDYLVQKAIDLGFPPVQAIQMATLNVAEHFDLEESVGGIAPGRFADIVIIPDLATIKPELVISNGVIVAEKGEIKVPPRPHRYPKSAYNSIHLGREFTGTDFLVPAKESKKSKVRIIEQVSKLLTRETIQELSVSSGQIEADATKDIIKVAAIERRYTPGKTFTGFIRGLGLKKGAIATSTCWDSSDIVVVGVIEADMALAVNRIQDLNGGMVICMNGQVADEIAFPVGGLISTEPMERLAEILTHIQETAHRFGCVSTDVRTTLSVLTTGAIPYIRICESGLFNLRSNSLVELIVE